MFGRYPSLFDFLSLMSIQSPASSSQHTYTILTKNLGKEFVDKSLLGILWFDTTMDVAQSDNFITQYGEKASTTVPQEVANILSDRSSAITFARQRLLTSVYDQERYYYGEIDQDRS